MDPQLPDMRRRVLVVDDKPEEDGPQDCHGHGIIP